VLLLEAGIEPPNFMNIPGLAKQNELISELTFQYQSVPQRYGAWGTNGGGSGRVILMKKTFPYILLHTHYSSLTMPQAFSGNVPLCLGYRSYNTGCNQPHKLLS